MNKFEEEIEKIKVEKEILEVLPKNNIRNIKKTYEKYEETYQEFLLKKDNILKEIEKRLYKEITVEKNKDIPILENKINKIEENLNIINDINTSFEKMGISENIHNLKYFYMKDLNLVNQNILECIEKFKKVGVILTEKDFIYNKYVYEYLKVFFNNIKDLTSSNIKEVFERVYWKCPEIITYIELNIRYLFFKNEKKIDKFYEEQNLKKIKEKNNILEEYLKLKNELKEKKILDKNYIIQVFFNGELNYKEYLKEKMLLDLSKVISKEILDELDDLKLEDLILEMIKFGETLNEYKIYTKYKFIIDNVNEVYKKKEKNKKIYEKIKKEITKKENKVLKLNKKSLFNKSEEKKLTKQTSIILELKDLYYKLDKYKVYYKIENKIKTVFNLIFVSV